MGTSNGKSHIVRFDDGSLVPWRAWRDRKSQYWVAVSDALGLAAQGETWSDLVSSIEEIQRLTFRDLLGEGQLEAYLRDHGLRAVSALPAAGERTVEFDIRTRVDLDLHAAA
jgi:predicted RNase H-like HicB family nuclease